MLQSSINCLFFSPGHGIVKIVEPRLNHIPIMGAGKVTGLSRYMHGNRSCQIAQINDLSILGSYIVARIVPDNRCLGDRIWVATDLKRTMAENLIERRLGCHNMIKFKLM